LQMPQHEGVKRPAFNCRYNTLMKLVFLATSSAIVYYMRGHKAIKMTYDKAHDTFRTPFLLAPAALLALAFTQKYTPLEVGRAALLD